MTHVGRATMATAVKAAKSMEPPASAMPTTTPTVKPSKPTASAVKTASTASTMKAATTASPMTAGDCRGVRHNAKCADCDARCWNAYCFLLHDAYPISKS